MEPATKAAYVFETRRCSNARLSARWASAFEREDDDAGGVLVDPVDDQEPPAELPLEPPLHAVPRRSRRGSG